LENQATNTKGAITPDFLPLRVVAAKLSLSRPTVCRLIKNGTIPSIRLSAWPLVPRQWLDDQVARANARLTVKSEKSVLTGKEAAHA